MKRTSILLATTAIFTASLILLSGSVTLAHSKSKDRIKDIKISEDVKMRYANDPPTEPGTLKVDPKTFKEVSPEEEKKFKKTSPDSLATQDTHHSHSHDHKAGHSHSHHDHDHEHDHDHHHDHHHDHDHKHDHIEGEDIFFAKGIAQRILVWNEYFVQLVFNVFNRFSHSKAIQTMMGVVFVSLPSIPIFLVLKTVSSVSTRTVKLMMCFASGSILGDVFLHILPELNSGNHSHDHSHEAHSHESHDDHSHHSLPEGYFFIILGIFVFYGFDRLMQVFPFGKSSEKPEADESQQISKTNGKGSKGKKSENKVKGKDEDKVKNHHDTHHDHGHHHHHHADEGGHVVFMYLFADFLHNAIDGLAIGVSFVGSTQLGISTTIATVLHELPHEVGDFAYLVKKKYTLPAILLTQLVTALGALVGGLIGIFLANIFVNYMLGFTAGSFLYFTMSHMIPEIMDSAKDHKSTFVDVIAEVMSFIFGLYLMLILVYTHSH